MATTIMLDYPAGQRRLLGQLFEQYQNVVLADQPVAYYPMNEATGTTTFDVSGHGNNGTIQGGVTLGQPGPIAGNAADTAYGFNGSTGYIEVPSAPLWDQAPTAFTVLAWVDAVTAGAVAGVQSMPTGSSPSGHGWNPLLWIQDGALYGSGLDQNNTPPPVTAPLSEGTHLVGLSQAAGITTLWIDGTLVDSSMRTPTYGNNITVFTTLGTAYTQFWPHSNGGWYYANGRIAHVAFFSTALSAHRFAEYYRAGRTAFNLLDAAGNWYTETVVEGDYPAQVLALHPTAYYPLNDQGGVAHDRAGIPPSNGSVEGGVTLNAPGPFTALDSVAMGFNGSTGYIQVPSAPLWDQAPTTFTILAWVDALTAGVVVGVQSVPVGTTPIAGWNPLLWIQDGALYGSGLDQTITPPPVSAPLSVGTHLVGLSQAAGITTLWIDGMQVGSSAQTPIYGVNVTAFTTLGTGYTLRWPGTNNGWYYANGKISHVAFWNGTALTGAQMQALYQAASNTYAFGPTVSGGKRGPLYVPQLVEASSYATTVLADHPGWYLPMQEGMGTTAYDRGGIPSNNGTLSGGVTLGQPGPFETLDSVAMGFNGSGSQIVSTHPVLNAANLSVECWINANSAVGCILGLTTGTGNAPQTALYFGGGGEWLGFNTSYSLSSGLVTGVPDLDHWVHVIGTYSTAQGSTLFINGVKAGGPTGIFGNGPEDLYLVLGGLSNMNGWYDQYGNWFTGSLAQAAVYNYALSPTQVALHYHAGQQHFLTT